MYSYSECMATDGDRRCSEPSADAPYHSGEGCSPVNVRLGGPPEAALPVSGVRGFCPVAPVTAHPVGEVAIVVLVVVHHDGRQESERHAEGSCRLPLCSASPSGTDSDVIPAHWCRR